MVSKQHWKLVRYLSLCKATSLTKTYALRDYPWTKQASVQDTYFVAALWKAWTLQPWLISYLWDDALNLYPH